MNDDLTLGERYWCTRQPWLKLKGYELRARYQPGWVPSWILDPSQDSFSREDLYSRPCPLIMDAVRIQDGKQVMLKIVNMPDVSSEDHELAIIQYLSIPDVSQDPQNRCVPVYEVLLNVPEDPTHAIIVMPLLRPFDNPRFDTVGEVLGCLKDIFEGIQFLHRHNIAHRDCTGANLMLDASDMYPDGFHPYKQERNKDFTGYATQKYTRTQRPPRYYWINFGLSVRFDATDQRPEFPVLRGNDRTPPEFEDPDYMAQPQNPFPTDIYYLGNLIRQYFTEGYAEMHYGRKDDLRFLKPLVAMMVQTDRTKRPTIDQCIRHLEEITRLQSPWSLRSQIWESTDSIVGLLSRLLPHWVRRIISIATQTPAIPKAEYRYETDTFNIP